MIRHSIRCVLAIATGLVLLLADGASICRAADSYTLKYKLKQGKTIKYVALSQMRQKIDIMGGEQVTTTKGNVQFRIKSEGEKDGNWVYTLTIDAFELDLKNQEIDSTLRNPTGLVGKRIRKVVDPFGDQIESVELDTIRLAPPFAQFFNSRAEFLMNLPKGKLSQGDTVTTADVDTIVTANGSVVSTANMNFVLQGKEKKLGHKCLRIAFQGKVNLEADQLFYQGTVEYSLKGEGTIEGLLYFDPKKGQLVFAESQSQMDMNAEVTDQYMTVPISQTSSSTVTLVK